MKKIAKIIMPLVLFALLVFPVMAQELDWDWEYTAEDEAAAAIAGGLGIGLIILWLVFAAIGLFFFIFWIIMLVDCVKRQFPERGMWLAILIISIFIGLSWLAAIIYYFVVKRKNPGSKQGGQPQPPQQPQQPTPPPPPPPQK